MADSRYPSLEGSTAALETVLLPESERRKHELIRHYNGVLLFRGTPFFCTFTMDLMQIYYQPYIYRAGGE